ncbi:MAG: hypothetical protein ACI8S6_002524 [Myxococcota bacterium]
MAHRMTVALSTLFLLAACDEPRVSTGEEVSITTEAGEGGSEGEQESIVPEELGSGEGLGHPGVLGEWALDCETLTDGTPVVHIAISAPELGEAIDTAQLDLVDVAGGDTWHERHPMSVVGSRFEVTMESITMEGLVAPGTSTLVSASTGCLDGWAVRVTVFDAVGAASDCAQIDFGGESEAMPGSECPSYRRE